MGKALVFALTAFLGLVPFIPQSPVGPHAVIGTAPVSAPATNNIVYSQDNEVSATGTSVTLNLSSAIASGATIICGIATNNTSGTPYTLGASDGTNGAYTQVIQFHTAFVSQTAIFRFSNSAAAGGGVTVTFTSTTSNLLEYGCVVYTGMLTASSPVDVAPSNNNTGGSGSGGTFASPNVTTNNAADLVLCILLMGANPGTASQAGGSGYTTRHSGQTLVGVIFADNFATTTGTYTGTTWTMAFGNTGDAAISTWKSQ